MNNDYIFIFGILTYLALLLLSITKIMLIMRLFGTLEK
jgi:hypothetical protein